MALYILIGGAIVLLAMVLVVLVLALRKFFSEDETDTDDLTEQIRSFGSMFAVIVADVAVVIAAAVIVVSAKTNKETTAIITSAFTAVTSITTAYLGIKAASNTAKNVIDRHAPPRDHGASRHGGGKTDAG